MKTKKLIGLSAAAVILVALAYISTQKTEIRTPSEVGKILLPKLDLGKIQQIELSKKGDKKLVLKGSDSGWTITSLYNYPADITKIRKNLLVLKDLKTGQRADSSKIANAELLDLQDESGKSLATLSLGEQHSRKATGQMAMYGPASIPDGRYVATGNSEKTYLVNETLTTLNTEPSNWADTQITDIPSSDINGIAIMHGDSAQLLSKQDGTWMLSGVEENEEFDTSKAYYLESALSSLSFKTLADPALNAEDMGITTGAVFKAMLKNGESYTASLGNEMQGSTDRYLKITAAFTPQGTNTTINTGLKAKIDAFNERTSQWTYVIPSSKAGNMIKTRADLVKEKVKEEKVKKE